MTDVYSLGLTDRDRVNSAFGGGLPTGSIALIEGADGAGKSVICQRLAYGLAEEGTAVGLLSAEQSLPEFLEQMDSLSYDVVKHVLLERLLFLEADVDTHNWANGRTRDLLGRLVGAEVLWRGEVVLVDRLDSILRNDPRFDDAPAVEPEAVMETLLASFRERTRDGTTIVLTLDPDGFDSAVLQPLRSVSDIFIELEIDDVGQELRRNMVVRRFAGQAAPVDDTIGFSVEQGRGITIESRTIA